MMINPRELRIGNYFDWEADHVGAGTSKVTSIHEDGFEVESLMGCHPDKEEREYGVKPITLTPEWLERMGFEKERQTMNLFGSYDIHFEMRAGRLYLIADSYEDEMKFVHQVQNIHYILTGNELRIKL